LLGSPKGSHPGSDSEALAAEVKVSVSSGDRETAVRRPAALRLHASISCPAPAALAASIASELSDLDAERAERAYDTLHPHVKGDAGDQLRALGGTPLATQLGGGPEALLLDRVLERGSGHPLLIAVILQELGRRAGLAVGIVAGVAGHFVAHQRLTEPLVLDPMTGRLVDADRLGVLQWRCGHQVAAELLDELQPRYERIGDLTRALHVARMRCTLPFDDTQDAEQRLTRLTARLN
jgi:hypothetical protein